MRVRPSPKAVLAVLVAVSWNSALRAADNGTAAERQASADTLLFTRLSEHPTLRDAWGEETAREGFHYTLATHQKWHRDNLPADYYPALATALAVGTGAVAQFFPERPFPASRLAIGRSTDDLAGFGPTPEFDRFGRPRVVYRYETSAPVFQNAFFGVGPLGSELARRMHQDR